VNTAVTSEIACVLSLAFYLFVLKVDLTALVSALLVECRKEKVSYRCVALESTGTILQHLNRDSFSQLYEIVVSHLPIPKVQKADLTGLLRIFVTGTESVEDSNSKKSGTF
jgi:hypothetical protein